MDPNQQFAQILVFEDKQQIQAPKRDSMRHYRKIEHEYNQWKDRRDWVIKNMHRLKGKKVEITVNSISNIATYECIVIDDILMLPYDDVAEMIFKVMKDEENAQKGDKTTNTEA